MLKNFSSLERFPTFANDRVRHAQRWKNDYGRLPTFPKKSENARRAPAKTSWCDGSFRVWVKCAAVGIPTIIDRAPPVRRLLSLVVHSISGICELNSPTICHVEMRNIQRKGRDNPGGCPYLYVVYFAFMIPGLLKCNFCLQKFQ